MLGAYVGAFALGATGNFWLALIAVPLAVGALGMLSERLLVRPLYGRGIDYPLLLTFGLGLIILDAVRILAGTEGIPFPTPEALSGAADLGFFFFPLLPAVPDRDHGRAARRAVALPGEDARTGSSSAPARAIRRSCRCSASMSAASG